MNANRLDYERQVIFGNMWLCIKSDTWLFYGGMLGKDLQGVVHNDRMGLYGFSGLYHIRGNGLTLAASHHIHLSHINLLILKGIIFKARRGFSELISTRTPRHLIELIMTCARLRHCELRAYGFFTRIMGTRVSSCWFEIYSYPSSSVPHSSAPRRNI